MLKKAVLILLFLFVVTSGGVLWLSNQYPPITDLTPIVDSSTLSPASNTTSISTGMMPATTPMSPSTTVTSYTLAEVAKHNLPNDCWLIVKGKVYDVDSYTGMHPGGSKTINQRCGMETTGIFSQVHSNRAWNLLGKYYIGAIKP